MNQFLSAGCKCIEKANRTIALVHHGGSLELSWSILVDGAKQATSDLGIDLQVMFTNVSWPNLHSKAIYSILQYRVLQKL